MRLIIAQQVYERHPALRIGIVVARVLRCGTETLILNNLSAWWKSKCECEA